MYASIYVCMYVSIYVCMYLSIYVSMYLCIYLSIYLSMYVSMYLCIYVSMYLSMYLCELYINGYCFGKPKTRHDQFVEQDIEQQEEVAAQSTLPEEAQCCGSVGG